MKLDTSLRQPHRPLHLIEALQPTGETNEDEIQSDKGFVDVNPPPVAFSLVDNGGRRLGLERRRFIYTLHIPERRSSEDRRGGFDRRGDEDRRSREERRSGRDRRNGQERAVVIDLRAYRDRRSSSDRRSGIDRRDFMIL